MIFTYLNPRQAAASLQDTIHSTGYEPLYCLIDTSVNSILVVLMQIINFEKNIFSLEFIGDKHYLYYFVNNIG
jgi:hypothetical protein